MSRRAHPLLPPDYTREEYQLLMYSVVNVYDKLPDIIDKLIVALVFDIGYKQNIAALILNVSDVAITKRIHKIKRLLGQEVNKSHIGSS